MQMVMTNSGVELRVENSIIYTTDSKAFWRSGNMLVGNGTVISYQCRSMDEAVDMVAALYNGKKTRSSASIILCKSIRRSPFRVDGFLLCVYSDSVAKRADFASTLIFCGMISSSLILCGQLHSRANCIQWELEDKKSDARIYLQKDGRFCETAQN